MYEGALWRNTDPVLWRYPLSFNLLLDERSFGAAVWSRGNVLVDDNATQAYGASLIADLRGFAGTECSTGCLIHSLVLGQVGWGGAPAYAVCDLDSNQDLVIPTAYSLDSIWRWIETSSTVSVGICRVAVQPLRVSGPADVYLLGDTGGLWGREGGRSMRTAQDTLLDG